MNLRLCKKLFDFFKPYLWSWLLKLLVLSQCKITSAYAIWRAKTSGNPEVSQTHLAISPILIAFRKAIHQQQHQPTTTTSNHHKTDHQNNPKYFYAIKPVLSSQTTIWPIIDPTLEIIDTAARYPWFTE